MRRRLMVAGLCAAVLLPVGYGLAQANPAGAHSGAQQPGEQQPGEQQAFAAAAHEFGVPQNVLLAVAYNESRWEQHDGQPSTSGSYGVMSLTDVRANAKGNPTGPQVLDTAAGLGKVSATKARYDVASNIRAGAALLASYARRYHHGTLPENAADWYGAVAAYSGSQSKTAATQFADDVYATLRNGASRTTTTGQQVRVPADPSITPDRSTITPLHLTTTKATSAAECPPNLDCDVVPAAYALNDPKDPTSYGNYDKADRPRTMKIDRIVLHDTEESYADTVAGFTNPATYTSANYVIRSSDGHVTQMVPTADVAWQAGNWYLNMHSVGIEQEGFAVAGASWYTEPLYRSSARLVRYLAARFDIPLDRQHIIGHDNVPGVDPAGQGTMHWDPGPYWDWGHYMALLGHPIVPTAGPHSSVVTIDPAFATNVQTVRDCATDKALPDQATSFVYLRTAPSTDAPLVSDPTLHSDGSAGTTCADDWGDKASVGQQLVVAGRQEQWTAIWWDGAKVWFHDDGASVPAVGFVVTPKPGKSEIPTYGRPVPEPWAYPSQIPVQAKATPLPYQIKTGQRYLTAGAVPTDYYYAKTFDNSVPGDHTDVVGHDRYLQIQLGHRIAYVKASDVNVTGATPEAAEGR